MSEAANGMIYRFTLKPGGSPNLMNAIVTLALKETEIIFGKARLKLETSWNLSPKKPTCTIEGGTECGEHLAKLVSGFLIKQVGETGFKVERLPKTQQKKT